MTTTFHPLPLWDFDGPTFEEDRDGPRLGRQLVCVRNVLRDREWHTLQELADECEASTQSVSARIRDLRKAKFGACLVDKERTGREGVWRYRMLDR